MTREQGDSATSRLRRKFPNLLLVSRKGFYEGSYDTRRKKLPALVGDARRVGGEREVEGFRERGGGQGFPFLRWHPSMIFPNSRHLRMWGDSSPSRVVEDWGISERGRNEATPPLSVLPSFFPLQSFEVGVAAGIRRNSNEPRRETEKGWGRKRRREKQGEGEPCRRCC